MIRPKAVQAPDIHHLNAAKGWLDLGDLEEAEAELSKISFWIKYHPDVLMVRWKVRARMQDWRRALIMAQSLTRIAPERPSSWICLSHSLCNSNRNLEAWRNLRNAAERFPKVSAIPYFLARLSCKLGNLPEATRWLNRWNSMVENPDMKQTAKLDPKLKPLWSQIDTPASADTPASDTARAQEWAPVSYSLTNSDSISRNN